MEALETWLAEAQQFTAQNPTLVWGLVLASVGLMLLTKIVPAMARGFKTCPKCQKVVPIKAETCRYCANAFPSEAPVAPIPAGKPGDDRPS